ncbi:MAG TPA: patatin-like phospholipase family protein [Methylomirabilota bacterium]|nr:patatin-like phospholipase family protein [Methylomirabilota bacterium]
MRGRARHPVVLLALLLPLAVGACAGMSRPPATAESVRPDAAAAAAAGAATTERLLEGLARRAVARGDRTLDLLLLSGGGPSGAYGSGFLRGWRTRSDGPMPRFDLVTGVGTGALQAPFALLGTEAALDAAAALGRDAALGAAPTTDWLFWVRRTGGGVDTGRYRRVIVERILSERMRDELWVELNAGRQLAIATTDLDVGAGHVWDLGQELIAGRGKTDRVQSVLLAATAVPGTSPSVVLDGHVHADGGIVSNVLPVLDLDGARRLAARLRGLGVTAPVTVRVWVVMNLRLSPPPVAVDPAGRSELARRGAQLLFRAQQPRIPERLLDVARAVGAEVPGLRMQVRHTAVPAEADGEPGAAAPVDEAWMRRLEQVGYERARGPAPWDEATPPGPRPRPR